ncbi:MAG: hypothetical protein RLZZ236_1092 [Bacteroidota bacterium]
MKNIKILFSFLLMLAVTISCSIPEGIDDDTSFLNSTSDPAAVTALATITQDNTGKVTLTPRGEGVAKFEVYFGDATTQPATVTPGNSVVHIYKEGIYKVKVVAFGITGKKTENVQDINVSFRSPENLVVTIENDKAVSKKVTIKATADFALFYEVYFGEDPNQVPVKVNNGESTSHIYATAGTYKIKIVSKSGAIKPTLYEKDFVVTAIMAPTASAPTPPNRAAGDVVSIFSSKYTNLTGTNFFPDWGQAGQGSSWAEFDLNGDKMLQYIKLSYQGIEFTTTNLSSMEYLHMDIWTADVNAIETFLIRNGLEKSVRKTLTPNAWNSIDIPLTDYTSQGLTLNDIFQFKFVGDGWAAGTVFIDNIYFYKAPSVPTAPSTNAPTPSRAASGVISIFSDAYTNINISEWNPGWGQSTTLNEVLIGSNKILKYSALNYTGIVTDYGNPTNLSNMTKVHFDYWTPDATSLGFKIVNTSFGNGDPRKESIVNLSSITTGTWVSVDLLLSNFTTDKSAITQMLFESSGGTVFIDNLYFY